MTRQTKFPEFRGAIVKLVCGGLIAGFLGCQTAAPHLRSKADREAYAQLTAEDRTSVDSGRLQKGMTPATVALAWGRPTQRRPYLDRGKERLEWLYWGTHWVDQPTWEYVYCDRFGTRWLDFRMHRVGVPFVRARAVFEENRLVDWQPVLP
jgi:hypothetical protein